ncbi:unnamed protein product [Sphacelaria rigidula]
MEHYLTSMWLLRLIEYSARALPPHVASYIILPDSLASLGSAVLSGAKALTNIQSCALTAMTMYSASMAVDEVKQCCSPPVVNTVAPPILTTISYAEHQSVAFFAEVRISINRQRQI